MCIPKVRWKKKSTIYWPLPSGLSDFVLYLCLWNTVSQLCIRSYVKSFDISRSTLVREKTFVHKNQILIKATLPAELLAPYGILYWKPRPVKTGHSKGWGEAHTQVQRVVVTLFLEVSAYGLSSNAQTSLFFLLLTSSTVAAGTISG